MSKADPAPPPAPQRRKSLWRRHRVGSLLVTMTLTLMLGALIYVMIGRPVAAPDWVRAEIEARASQALGGGQLHFDVLELVVDDDATPRVRMSDVQVIGADGAEIIGFGELRAGISLGDLLQGEVRPTDFSISGIFAKVRRQADGSIELSGGLDLSPSTRKAVTLPDLIQGLDDTLLRPELSAFRRADIESLTLRVEDVHSGRAWTVDGGRMRLLHEDDSLRITSDLALLSGGQGVATLEANYESRIGEASATFGANVMGMDAGDIAVLAPPFAWLDVLRAPISGALRSGVLANGRLAPINATLTIGAGVIQPTDTTRPVPFAAARSYFTYDPAERLLTFDELSVESAWITARIEGQTVLGLEETGRLEDIVGQFRASTFTANPDALYPEPVSFEAAEMDFRLSLDPFRLDVGQAVFQDQGQTLLAHGMLEAAPEGWRYGVDVRMDGLLPDRLLQLWPEDVVVKTRTWIADNLMRGSLRDLDVVVRDDSLSAPNIYVGFAYEDADVRYAKTLPPIKGARGTASLLDHRLVVTVDAGHVTAPQGGDLDVAGSSFIIPDVTVKGGAPAVVRIESESSITAALSILDLPPLSVLSKAGLAPDLAGGRLSVAGTLALPLRQGLQPSELEFNASASARDVVSTALIPNRRLAADTLSVTATNTGIEISGPGTLDGVPFDAAWAQPIGAGPQPGRVAGTIELSERTIDAFRIGLPPGMVTGRGRGDIVVDLPAGGAAPSFSLETDLRGVRLSAPPLGWSKGPNARARLSVAGQLGARPRIDRLELNAPGLRANGAITLSANGGLARARFGRVRVGEWLDAPVDLVGRGPGAPPGIEVRGGTLDLRRADFGGAGSGTGGGRGGGPLSLALDRLQITDIIALTGMRGQFGLARGLDGEFTAQINGGTGISGRIVPQNGRSAIRVTARDAGGVAASAGILKQARGGSLELTLRPVGAASFDGSLQILETRIQDAPAIAALLNALSVVGLLDQLNGPGIHFQEVEANFRLTPSSMVLTQASAVGPSMGLSMFGTYDVTRKILDMQGVVSPLFLVNGIGSIFTRKGEGLIGFNYNLVGPAAKPRVQVNPLSALTPGLFRELFRRPPPTVPEVEGQSKSFLPDTRAETPAQKRRRVRREARDNR